MLHVYGILPHEQLMQRFEIAFDNSKEFHAAEDKYHKACEDFDLNATQENANKILSALTNLEVERAKLRYAIVHEKDEKPASSFMYQIRHT